MYAVACSKTLVAACQNTWQHSIEDCNIYAAGHGKLRSQMFFALYVRLYFLINSSHIDTWFTEPESIYIVGSITKYFVADNSA